MKAHQLTAAVVACLVTAGCSDESLSREDNHVEERGPTIKNDHDIEGYTTPFSAAPGESVEFKIHSPQPPFSIEIFRTGAGEKAVARVNSVDGGPQDYPENAAKIGAGWKADYTLTIPDDWTSGLYAAKVSDGSGSSSIGFVVREKEPGASKIAVLVSNFTWQAYNTWPTSIWDIHPCENTHSPDCRGASFYTYFLQDGKGVNGTSPFVSLDRPNPHQGDPFSSYRAFGERYMLEWLEKTGHPYGLLSDVDLTENPSLLKNYKALIVHLHPEYWSAQMYDAAIDFLNAGGYLLYLGGNGVYWKVTLKDGQLEVRKDHYGGPPTPLGTHEHTGELGGQWRDLGRPESQFLGVEFSTPHGLSLMSCAPYKVVDPTHWVFENTGVKAGDLIGSNSRGLDNVANGCHSAAGFEMDFTTEQSPKNLVRLAKGTNHGGDGIPDVGADLVYYDHPGGGGVLSVGSITFTGSLDEDPALSKMVDNVLAKALQGGAP